MFELFTGTSNYQLQPNMITTATIIFFSPVCLGAKLVQSTHPSSVASFCLFHDDFGLFQDVPSASLKLFDLLQAAAEPMLPRCEREVLGKNKFWRRLSDD